jgi:predicted phage terminase large subunit-like protein
MQLNADILYGFTNYMLLSRFDNPKPSPQCHYEWWDLVTSPNPYVAIGAPRGHAKSTAITHAYVLASVAFRVKKFVLIVSDTEKQAVMFLANIKKELEENTKLTQGFGIKGIDSNKNTETDIIVNFLDGKQFRIICRGSEQRVRGFLWNGMRPDLVVGDDLENDEIVMNEERRAKFSRWFNDALLPCGSDTCHYRIVGTILHLDSALENLMPSFTDPNVEYDGLKWWKPQDKYEPGDWVSYRYQAHNKDFSKILWPEKFSEERLKAIRQRYINQGHPEGYSQEYLNYPIDESTAYFRKADLLPIDEETLGEYGEHYAAADLAISQKDHRAYSVIITGKLLNSGVLQIVDVLRFRGDSLDIINNIFATQGRYDIELFGIEQENIAKAIGPILYKEMGIDGNPYVSIEKLPPIHDKEVRARPIQKLIRAGKVQFDQDAEWWPELQQELIHFPRGKYNDQVDALAWLGFMIDKMAYVPTKKEIEEELYEEEKEELQDPIEIGMNWITHY